MVVAAALPITGCSSGATTIVPDPDAVASFDELEETSEESIGTQEESSEPAPQDETSELDSRQEPLPIGTTVILEDRLGLKLGVSLGSPMLEANDIVAAENMFNDEPLRASSAHCLPFPRPILETRRVWPLRTSTLLMFRLVADSRRKSNTPTSRA